MGRRFTSRQRVALYLAQGGKCAICGAELEPGWHGDHVQPWSHGGATDVVNGQALCATCNLKKGSGAVGKLSPRAWQEEAIAVFETRTDKGCLIEATPGAGKTVLMAEIARRAVGRGEVDAIVVVVPTVGLKEQVARAIAEQSGIQLDYEWDGDCPLIRTRYRGAVVTYAWVASKTGALRHHVSRQPTLGILDEVHHANRELSWGKSLGEAFEPAMRVLLTSGTPFRSDGGAIPFVGYIPFADELRAAPDYVYGYGRALTDGIVRSVYFNRHGGTMEWSVGSDHWQKSFDDDVDDQNRSRRLRTALAADGDHLGGVLREAIYKLEELRLRDPDAGGLVIAIDQVHAKAIATRMRREWGVDPILVISEDADASRKLRSFAKGSRPWIVAVRMVSEGIDIPRLRVCVFATNIVTELYFRQAVGRVVRIQLDHEDHTAYFFICDDPRLREWAQRITDECQSALRERDSAERERRGASDEEDEDDSSNAPYFLPISSTFRIAGTTIGLADLTPDELAHAEAVRRKTPTAAGLTREVIAEIIRNAGIAVQHIAEPVREEAVFVPDELVKLRAQNNKIVARICERHSLDFNVVNGTLNKAVGIKSIKICDDLAKLKRRMQLAETWLSTGTPAA